MAGEQRFEHNPSFSSQYPQGWTRASENIAWVSLSGSISEAVRRSFNNLVDSPGHYDNMTDPDITHIGIGIDVRGNNLWVTQNFAAYPATGPGPEPDPDDQGTRPVAGDIEVSVYFCAPAGRYSAAHMADEVAIMNRVITGYFQRESSGLVDLRFALEGTVSPDIQWDDSSRNSLHAWHQQMVDTKGKYKDPCYTRIPSGSDSKQS